MCRRVENREVSIFGALPTFSEQPVCCHRATANGYVGPLLQSGLSTVFLAAGCWLGLAGQWTSYAAAPDSFSTLTTETTPSRGSRSLPLTGEPISIAKGWILDGPQWIHTFATQIVASPEDDGSSDEVAAPARNRFVEATAGHEVVAAPIINGVATVDAKDSLFDEHAGVLRTFFQFPVGPSSGSQIRNGDSEVAARLNAWFAEGSAAGNVGDLYDNRDRKHSLLPEDAFPQLSRVAYGSEAVEAGIDLSMAWPVIFNLVTFGNASLAVTSVPEWRSLPRLLLTLSKGADLLFLLYTSNQIYVFPEHRDHDADLGDLLPANTPYYIISQGSSGSDQPFLYAIASILSAFRPEVKSFLIEKGLIAPTIQWIFRRSQRGVESENDYLGAKAHPTVFEKERLDLEAMIERAHDLEIDAVPPMVQIKVIDESTGRPGIDWFDPRNETLFDTPSAIARVIRSTADEKRMVVDAGATKDPNGLPLTFHWSVIGGDNRIVITPLNKSGSIAEVVVPWQERRPGADWPIISSDRVDVAVFANNGKNWSAPALLSLLFPANQRRIYRSDGRIAEVDYDPPEFRDRYVDPVVFPKQRWKDTYRYDDNGSFLGWVRTSGTERTAFTREGAQVLDVDALGRPTRAELLRYEIVRGSAASAEVNPVSTGTVLEYVYDGDADRLGKAVRISDTN